MKRADTGELPRQPAAKIIHEAQGILGGLMRHVQVDHGGGDLFMTEQFLNRVQMRAGFQQMRGKGMTQRMQFGGGEVELFARRDQEPLEEHGMGEVAWRMRVASACGLLSPRPALGKSSSG